MIASCPAAAETRRLVAERLADTISAADARALKGHVSSCRGCANEALLLDPTLVFAPLSAERPTRSEESEARALAASVLSAVEMERTRRRLGPPVRRVVLRAASVALLAGALVVLLRVAQHGPDRPDGPVAAAPAPAAEPAAATRFVLEDLPAGATVYQFASSSPREPNVVFVVHRNADI